MNCEVRYQEIAHPHFEDKCAAIGLHSSGTTAEAMLKAGMEIANELKSLVGSLDGLGSDNKNRIVTELGKLGANLINVVNSFRQSLRAASEYDAEETVRSSAFHALTLIGTTQAPEIPTLIYALQDPAAIIRAQAAVDLARIGTAARDGIPALIRACVHDANVTVRVQAAVALWRIGRRFVPAIPALVEGLKSENPTTCSTAAACLGEMGAIANSAVPVLQETKNRQQIPMVKEFIERAIQKISTRSTDSTTFEFYPEVEQTTFVKCK